MYGARLGLYLRNGARNQAMNEIEIVDHQIEHDADVGASSGPRPGAHAFDRYRRVVEIEQPALGEDEALLMADGQHAAHVVCELHQLVRFMQRRRDRLLHQHMGAGGKKGAHNLGMRARGRADADEIHFAQKVAPIGEHRHVQMHGDLPAGVRAGIGDGRELHARKAHVFGGMMAAEMASHDNCRSQRPSGGYSMNIQATPSPNANLAMPHAGSRAVAPLIKCFALLHVG